ncbi:MAG: hypothetical protein LBV45_08285 [Xanthomonadaceae bacterium]|jgi:hypothetical protein|nr:hypothetical protein [Xanthomonadaceae bacterium]
MESWWLIRLGMLLMWARLRVRDAGTAEVLDGDGRTLNYDSEDSARAALLDAGFIAFDGLDEEDAMTLGVSLDELTPPQGEDDDRLIQRMTQRLGHMA